MDAAIYKELARAYNNFDSRPLKGESLRNFYVDDLAKHATDSIITTVNVTDRFRKMLIIGHTGCGKSTILNKVAEDLENVEAIKITYRSLETVAAKKDVTPEYFGIPKTLVDREFATETELRRAVELAIQGPNIRRYVEEILSEAKNPKYHVVAFSVADELPMEDVEVIDILMVIYIKLLSSVPQSMPDKLWQQFHEVVKTIKGLNIKEIEFGIQLVKSVAFKIKVEPESREMIRKALGTRLNTLQQNISEACSVISRQTHKDLVVIIDDLDKLNDELAQKVFFQQSHLLNMINAKILLTCPLVAYYSPSFVHISDKFSAEFIRLVNLFNAKRAFQEDAFSSLKNMVIKRIDQNLITEDALRYLVTKSGGLLRDLMKFMQDACKFAVQDGSEVIGGDIPRKVIQEKINEYRRLFDFREYGHCIRDIVNRRDRLAIDTNRLIYLIRYLFVLEYGRPGEQSWYDLHPCLKECLSGE